MRPKESITEDPRAWIRYAANCLMHSVEEIQRSRTWERVLELRELRHRYIDLFTQARLAKTFASASVAASREHEMDKIERELNFDQIRLFRALARRQFARSGRPTLSPQPAASASSSSLALSTSTQTEAPKDTTAAPSSWLTWIWSGGSGTGAAIDASASTPSSPTVAENELKAALYDTIDYDDEADQAFEQLDLPPKTRIFSIAFTLQTGSIALLRMLGDGVSRERVVNLSFSNLSASLTKRTASLCLEANLETFCLDEAILENSLCKTIARPKKRTAEAREPVFAMSWDQMPSNENADEELRITILPLDIYINSQAFAAIRDFFLGERNLKVLESFADAAESRFKELASKTRDGLVDALKQHKPTDIFIDMAASTVAIPLNSQDPTEPVYVIDLGSLRIRSRLLTRGYREGLLKRLSSEVISTADFSDADWYDRLDISLRAFTVHGLFMCFCS